MINFDKALKELITACTNIANNETCGFILTNETLCDINTMVIILHEKNVICDKLTDEQVENVYSTYNKIIQNKVFK